MRIVIVGQSWFGAEALRLCLRRGDEVAKVLAPASAGEEYDRLYAAAQQAGVPAEHCGRRVTAADIPAGADLIVAAHAHAFIDASADSFLTAIVALSPDENHLVLDAASDETVNRRVEAAEQLPIGARLVAISKDLTVWEHMDVEYQVPRRCIRAVVGSYRNATLKIGEML
jgi:hypothetical protein